MARATTESPRRAKLTWLHPKQREFVNSIDPTGRVSETHLVTGRGFGKTHAGCVKMYRSCMEWNPGLPHLWTEPTYGDCLKAFLRVWTDAIPGEDTIWHHAKADKQIVFANGSVIDYYSRDTHEPGRGPNYCVHIADEPAKDRSGEWWTTIFNSIRHPEANVMFCDSISTPRMNWYYDLVMNGAGRMIHGTSFDNPYTRPDYVPGMLARAPELEARQEVYGEWVPQSGRIWRTFVDEPWSDGNRTDREWDASREYVLACDLGRTSAWLIIQSWAVSTPDRMLAEDTLDVAVAEWTPTNEDTQQTLARIYEFVGGRPPAAVYVGADVNTKVITDSQDAAGFFRTRFDPVFPIVFPTGRRARKSAQLEVGLQRLERGGHRHFAVSNGLISHDATSKNRRGILDVFERDCWEDKNPRIGEYLPKEGVLEHMRDAYLYWAVGAYPPYTVPDPGGLSA